MSMLMLLQPNNEYRSYSVYGVITPSNPDIMSAWIWTQHFYNEMKYGFMKKKLKQINAGWKQI